MFLLALWVGTIISEKIFNFAMKYFILNNNDEFVKANKVPPYGMYMFMIYEKEINSI